MSYLALDIGGTNLRIGLGNGTNKWKKFQEIPLDNNKIIFYLITLLVLLLILQPKSNQYLLPTL